MRGQGENNSQFGKRWYHCPLTLVSKPYREGEVPDGWIKGKKCTHHKPRVMKMSEKKSVICKQCSKVIEVHVNKEQLFCSRYCSMIWRNANSDIASKGGKKSASLQIRRSKNEIHFASLCSEHFTDVTNNEVFFDGWDADIILHEQKIAILWNGPWHYKKITRKHSVLQVQNRDKLKAKKIEEKGYIVYTIKDLGSENPDFVNREFTKFLSYIAR